MAAVLSCQDLPTCVNVLWTKKDKTKMYKEKLYLATVLKDRNLNQASQSWFLSALLCFQTLFLSEVYFKFCSQYLTCKSSILRHFGVHSITTFIQVGTEQHKRISMIHRARHVSLFYTYIRLRSTKCMKMMMIP